MKHLPWLLGFDMIYLAFCFLGKGLSSIETDKEKQQLTIVESNLLNIKRCKTFELAELQYTYKRRASASGRTVSIVNVCTFYKGETVIADLVPMKGGWQDDEILNLVYELIDLGVTKKFVGYNLKDVELKE